MSRVEEAKGKLFEYAQKQVGLHVFHDHALPSEDSLIDVVIKEGRKLVPNQTVLETLAIHAIAIGVVYTMLRLEKEGTLCLPKSWM